MAALADSLRNPLTESSLVSGRGVQTHRLSFVVGFFSIFDTLVISDDPFLLHVYVPLWLTLFVFAVVGGWSRPLAGPIARYFWPWVGALTIGLAASLFYVEPATTELVGFGARASSWRPLISLVKETIPLVMVVTAYWARLSPRVFRSLVGGFGAALALVLPYTLIDWAMRSFANSGLPRLGNSRFTEIRQTGATLADLGVLIHRAAGPQGEPKGLAWLVIVAAGFLVAYVAKSRVRTTQFLLCGSLLILTFSSAGWLVGFVCTLVLVMLQPSTGTRGAKRTVRAIGSVALVVTSSILMFAGDLVEARFGAERFDRWDRHRWAVEAWSEAPLGSGIGSAAVRHAIDQDATVFGGSPPTFFALLVEAGLIGVLLALGGFLAMVLSGVSVARKTHDTETAILVVLVVGYLTWTVDTIVFGPLIAMPIGFLGGRIRLLREGGRLHGDQRSGWPPGQSFPRRLT